MAGDGLLKNLFQKKDDDGSESSQKGGAGGTPRWSMGVLNDKETIEVPGSVLLLASDKNEPLGLRHAPARTSQSSIPTAYPSSRPGTPRRSSASGRPAPPEPTVKKTSNGQIILEPQPEDSANDPLNWPTWRRDAALLSLGFYCMVGGGITPLLAAGFTDISDQYGVEVEEVALTTGLYMLGLGLGSVIFSPTAILWGKRPVYLGGAIIFILSCVWCALSPTFSSLVVARIFQGIAVSPVECLPSATIAEIFFLHERAFRIGVYTLLLLGGKNLVPLVSAAIIQRLSWQWVFWIVAFVVAFGAIMLFLFVPETFWDRTPHPRPKGPSARPSFIRRLSSRYGDHQHHHASARPSVALDPTSEPTAEHDSQAKPSVTPAENAEKSEEREGDAKKADDDAGTEQRPLRVGFVLEDEKAEENLSAEKPGEVHQGQASPSPAREQPSTPEPAASGNDKERAGRARNDTGGVSDSDRKGSTHTSVDTGSMTNPAPVSRQDPERAVPEPRIDTAGHAYTHRLRQRPAQTFLQQLRPYHGRLSNDNWFRVMVRPFILFSYPAILWSSVVYACSVGWLIVISESMAMIYQDSDSYNFDSLQTGLVYLSPFIGGLLGTAVAGRVSDVIVKAMARRNGGLYEPEFRLVMAIPIIITTVIGLMGFGWSAEERDHFMVPTVFFGVISFGCSLGSTTSITFCVDSYRQYAGEALVTLNFSKNVLHGLVFSLFFTHWLSADGPKMVFIWTGIIQLLLMLATLPLFIFGKRWRMWTVRKNLVERSTHWGS